MDDLRARIAERLAALARETALGQERLRALEDEAAELRATLLRIAGATQVLREVLDADGCADVVAMTPAATPAAGPVRAG
ncbi:hypothetical protein [Pseudonocardia charpentierae]|uniref:Uncharacterized protein n=1 Tax=Pseudonocardia charpentierae TaxID=3075545 RepID=A0ABU2NJE3_9PSEU|nr:hypothetical protein [Pseudonocardia sp. DSM 45834]MDT0353138.1 hypothetical protein [Pseudonocardia sp. DSM 45834]